MSTRTPAGYELERANNKFDRIAARRHPRATYLVEVFERDGIDYRRPDTDGYGDTIGELWIMDELALADSTRAEWDAHVIESVGFNSDEMRDLIAGDELEPEQRAELAAILAELEQTTEPTT